MLVLRKMVKSMRKKTTNETQMAHTYFNQNYSFWMFKAKPIENIDWLLVRMNVNQAIVNKIV